MGSGSFWCLLVLFADVQDVFAGQGALNDKTSLLDQRSRKLLGNYVPGGQTSTFGLVLLSRTRDGANSRKMHCSYSREY